MSRLGRALRRAAYPLAALPVDIACLVLLLLGRRPPAARLRSGLGRLSGGSAPTSGDRRPPPTGGSPLPRLVADLIAFPVAGYLWLLLPMNWAYPLRADLDANSHTDGWGGPTLAGAWAVHAGGGTLFFLVIGLPLLLGATRLLERLRAP